MGGDDSVLEYSYISPLFLKESKSCCSSSRINSEDNHALMIQKLQGNQVYYLLEFEDTLEKAFWILSISEKNISRNLRITIAHLSFMTLLGKYLAIHELLEWEKEYI